MKQAIAGLKNLLWLSSFILASLNVKSQIVNYVTNGGFEKHFTCDITNTITLNVSNAPGWNDVGNMTVTLWRHYCYGGVPVTYFYNYPHTDSAYVAYDFFCLSCAPDSRRTNIRNTLKAKLQAGKTYCVKFYVNNSEGSSYAIDGVDAYFGGDELIL